MIAHVCILLPLPAAGLLFVSGCDYSRWPHEWKNSVLAFFCVWRISLSHVFKANPCINILVFCVHISHFLCSSVGEYLSPFYLLVFLNLFRRQTLRQSTPILWFSFMCTVARAVLDRKLSAGLPRSPPLPPASVCVGENLELESHEWSTGVARWDSAPHSVWFWFIFS